MRKNIAKSHVAEAQTPRGPRRMSLGVDTKVARGLARAASAVSELASAKIITTDVAAR